MNNRTPAPRQPATPDAIAIWGPNVSLAFLTGRIEDASKGNAHTTNGNKAIAA